MLLEGHCYTQVYGSSLSWLFLLLLLKEDIMRHFGYLYSLGGLGDLEKRRKRKRRVGEKEYIKEMRGKNPTLVHNVTNPCAGGINNRYASIRR